MCVEGAGNELGLLSRFSLASDSMAPVGGLDSLWLGTSAPSSKWPDFVEPIRIIAPGSAYRSFLSTLESPSFPLATVQHIVSPMV